MIPTVGWTDEFAAAAHAGQVDKAGVDYIQHPRRVAARLTINGEWAIMAGLLHDVVEDTTVTLDELRRHGFPEVVVEAVDAVSRRDGESYQQMLERAANHPLGALVKLADNAENGDPARLALLEDPEREWFTGKYARARETLMQAVADGRVDPYAVFGMPW